LELRRHPLLDFIILNNCGAIYLVNNLDFLEKDFYIKNTDYNDWVVYGSSSLPVKGRGTRIIKDFITTNSKIRNLVFNNVAFIKDFHITIVSEAKLYKAGI